MERDIPKTVSQLIDMYTNTYYSLLRSSTEILIETIIEAHQNTQSLLHHDAAESTLDIDALTYTYLRLPDCLKDTSLILLGQRTSVFERFGYHVEDWTLVSAPARRRRSYYNEQETLALYIASRSDIDDIMPALAAYQLEWNKLHNALRRQQDWFVGLADDYQLSEWDIEGILNSTGLSEEGWARLNSLWGDNLLEMLKLIAAEPKRLRLRLLAGSIADYQKAMSAWWRNIESTVPNCDLSTKRVYFVSSNVHSLLNLWTGYSLRKRDEILAFMKEPGNEAVLAEYEKLTDDDAPIHQDNLFYYLAKPYFDAHGGGELEADYREKEIEFILNSHEFELAAQVIPIASLNPGHTDPRLLQDDIEMLSESQSLILNIDYPLGMAAYSVMTRIMENIDWLAGVYIMGKAATLNGRVGDVMIPTVVHDEHSNNTYLFDNCFTAADVSEYMTFGNVLDNQKAVTVLGTFLQNQDYMEFFYREGFTDIEMEAGPYLSGIYELLRPKRYPNNEIVTLYGYPLDLGIIHYASDTPLTKGSNLGAGSMSYMGIDGTYASAVAILRRIIKNEIYYVKHGADRTVAKTSGLQTRGSW